jgi:hypothetical protein
MAEDMIGQGDVLILLLITFRFAGQDAGGNLRRWEKRFLNSLPQ